MQVKDIHHIDAAATAKLVRRALKAAFPEQQFRVRTSRYAGGASIAVKWTDGPLRADVEPIAQQYEGGGFDGSIDVAYHCTHYLRPDGRVLVRHDPGTVGSRGTHPGTDNRDLEPVLPDEAEPVRFGADYIFCEREVSDAEAKRQEAVAWIYANLKPIGDTANPNVDQLGSTPVALVAQGMVERRRDGETFWVAWRRW